MPLLNVTDLNVGYGELQVLWNLNLSVEEGQIASLIGSNGAGKSTTLKTVAGILKPKAGFLEFDGRRVERLEPHRAVNEGIVYVPEGRRVFPRLSVHENLELGAYSARARPSKEESMLAAYELFPILKERRDQPAGTLTGGEQQMLAIVRGLMTQMLESSNSGANRATDLVASQLSNRLRAIFQIAFAIFLNGSFRRNKISLRKPCRRQQWSQSD